MEKEKQIYYVLRKGLYWHPNYGNVVGHPVNAHRFYSLFEALKFAKSMPGYKVIKVTETLTLEEM